MYLAYKAVYDKYSYNNEEEILKTVVKMQENMITFRKAKTKDVEKELKNHTTVDAQMKFLSEDALSFME